MGKLKESYISFRSDDVYFRKINELAGKLGVSRSECIRLMLDQGMEKYLGVKSSLFVVDNEKWNVALGEQLEDFMKKVVQVTELATTLTKQAKRSGNVQGGDIIDVTEADLGRWIDEAVRDDRNFNVGDINPAVQKVKKAILITVQKLKGRVV